MGITYPDNTKRQDRLVELATRTQSDLDDTELEFTEYKTLLLVVNSQITSLYKENGLKEPEISDQDIFKLAGVATDVQTDDTITQISTVIVDVAGLFGQVKYFAPAISKLMVKTGVMTAETAGKVLVRFSIPLVGKEIEITAGQIASNVVGGILGGILIVGIDIGIEAIEGAALKKKLVDAIHAIYPLRSSTHMSLLKVRELNNGLRAIKTTLDVLVGAGLALSEEVINSIIQKDAEPSIARANAITLEHVQEVLRADDAAHDAYTHEDP